MVVKVLVPPSGEDPPRLGRVHNVTHSRLVVINVVMTMKMAMTRTMTIAMKTVVTSTVWTT